MKKIYKFSWDCGYGNIEGIFIADEKEVKNIIGKEIYFSEVLGKHSEVYDIIEQEDITEIKASKEFIQEAEKIFGSTISGYNPIDYLGDEEEGDDDGEID